MNVIINITGNDEDILLEDFAKDEKLAKIKEQREFELLWQKYQSEPQLQIVNIS